MASPDVAAGTPDEDSAPLDRPGHAKGGPYSDGAYPGAGQYGTMTVSDGAHRLRVVLTGRDYRGREVVRYAYSLPHARR